MRSKIILFILCSLGKLEAYGLIKQVQELSASWSGMEGEAFLGRGGGSAGRDHDHDAWTMGFASLGRGAAVVGLSTGRASL